MPWVSQALSGTIDGVNKTFMISFAPAPAESMIMVYSGVYLEAVGSAPDQMQFAYSVTGTSVTLGLAPTAGKTLFAIYWH